MKALSARPELCLRLGRRCCEPSVTRFFLRSLASQLGASDVLGGHGGSDLRVAPDEFWQDLRGLELCRIDLEAGTCHPSGRRDINSQCQEVLVILEAGADCRAIPEWVWRSGKLRVIAENPRLVEDLEKLLQLLGMDADIELVSDILAPLNSLAENEISVIARSYSAIVLDEVEIALDVRDCGLDIECYRSAVGVALEDALFGKLRRVEAVARESLSARHDTVIFAVGDGSIFGSLIEILSVKRPSVKLHRLYSHRRPDVRGACFQRSEGGRNGRSFDFAPVGQEIRVPKDGFRDMEGLIAHAVDKRRPAVLLASTFHTDVYRRATARIASELARDISVVVMNTAHRPAHLREFRRILREECADTIRRGQIDVCSGRQFSPAYRPDSKTLSWTRPLAARVIRRLRNHRDCPVLLGGSVLAAVTPIVRTFVNRQLPHLFGFARTAEAEFRIGGVLALAVCPGRPAAIRALTLAARRQGVKTIDVQALFVSKRLRYLPPVAEISTVIESGQRDLYVRHFGIPADRTYCVGYPQLDQGRIRSRSIDRADGLEAGVNATTFSQILFASQSDELERSITVLRALIDCIASIREVRIAVRPHPAEVSERVDAYAHVLSRLGDRGWIDRDSTLEALIDNSDLVVVRFSNVGLQAALRDTPVIAVRLNGEEPILNLAEMGIALGAESEIELSEKVLGLLGNSERRLVATKRQRAYFEENPHLLDGNGAERIAALVIGA